MKKSFVIVSALAPTVALLAGLCLSLNNGSLKQLRANDVIVGHHITFTFEDVEEESVSGDDYEFHLFKEGATYFGYDFESDYNDDIGYEECWVTSKNSSNPPTFKDGYIFTAMADPDDEDDKISFHMQFTLTGIAGFTNALLEGTFKAEQDGESVSQIVITPEGSYSDGVLTIVQNGWFEASLTTLTINYTCVA